MEPEVCGSASEILIFFVAPNQNRIQIRNYRGNRVEADSCEVLPESITQPGLDFLFLPRSDSNRNSLSNRIGVERISTSTTRAAGPELPPFSLWSWIH
jgi:hypothetical protein